MTIDNIFSEITIQVHGVDYNPSMVKLAGNTMTTTVTEVNPFWGHLKGHLNRFLLNVDIKVDDVYAIEDDGFTRIFIKFNKDLEQPV